MFFKNKAILMIHGFVGGIYDFGSLHNELQLYRKFDVFTFTLPAHEKFIVNDVKHHEWINEATKQIEFLINNGYKEIYIIGHSMGGVIGTYLASKYTEVKKLVLAAPAFRYFHFKDGTLDMKSLNKSFKHIPGMIKDFNAEQIISKILKTPIPTIIEFTKLVNKYQHCVDYITCDTLTIRGLSDTLVPDESVKHVYNSIKSKTNILLNVKDLNHDCFISPRSQELNDIVKNFLIKKSPPKKEEIEI